MGIMRGTVPLERQEVEQCGCRLAKNHNVSVSCENMLIALITYTALCNDLSPLANGMIIYNGSEGPHRTVATYTCDEGFQLQGDEIRTRTCEDGVWAEASPLQSAQEGMLRYVKIIDPSSLS